MVSFVETDRMISRKVSVKTMKLVPDQSLTSWEYPVQGKRALCAPQNATVNMKMVESGKTVFCADREGTTTNAYSTAKVMKNALVQPSTNYEPITNPVSLFQGVHCCVQKITNKL